MKILDTKHGLFIVRGIFRKKLYRLDEGSPSYEPWLVRLRVDKADKTVKPQ